MTKKPNGYLVLLDIFLNCDALMFLCFFVYYVNKKLLIIGNVPGARRPNDPNPEWEVVAAAVTRTQARELGNPKSLKLMEMTSKMVVDKDELIRLHEEDSTLQKFKETKGTDTRKGYRISYEKRGGIWYRVRQRRDEVGDVRKQILVPKSLRAQVMEVAHDSLFGGHLEVKKTENRIQTNFFWLGLHDDVTRFCRSCDVCPENGAQRIGTTGSIGRYSIN